MIHNGVNITPSNHEDIMLLPTPLHYFLKLWGAFLFNHYNKDFTRVLIEADLLQAIKAGANGGWQRLNITPLGTVLKEDGLNSLHFIRVRLFHTVRVCSAHRVVCDVRPTS